jgi:coproporphyrinogen III oxidase-like Fe-S oxidoreductase
MNLGTSDAYARDMRDRNSAIGSIFEYTTKDLKLLHLTRNLSRLSIDCSAYELFFGTDLEADFPSCFSALEDARLVRRQGARIELTPEGMFYADAVAGLLAHRRVAELRRGADDRVGLRQHMG